MSVLPILEYPHPLLRRRARRIPRVDRTTYRLFDNMAETVVDAGGVGLAANQVGVLRRVIVIHLPGDPEPRVYVNPEIIYRRGQRKVPEGCLSVPAYYGIVPRSLWVRTMGLDRQSRVFRLHANGLLAQALEHEIDHLNGIMFLDHLESHEQLIRYDSEADAELESKSEGTDETPVEAVSR